MDELNAMQDFDDRSGAGDPPKSERNQNKVMRFWRNWEHYVTVEWCEPYYTQI